MGYLTAAFGLVAGLAWNDAIAALIQYYFPANGDSLILKFAYAVFVTVLVVVITISLMRVARRPSSEPRT